MENNFSDKQMRDKLKGIEAPFDPQAWEQMEAKLDNEKKRRGFFWWWFSGAAAGMLLLAGVLGYQQLTVHGSQSNRSSVYGLPAGQAGLQSKVNTGPVPVNNLPVNSGQSINNKQQATNQPLTEDKPGLGEESSSNNHPSAINAAQSINNLPNRQADKQRSAIKTTLNKRKEHRLLSKLNAGNNKSGNEENHYLIDPKSVSEAGILETALNRLHESSNQKTESPSTNNTGQEVQTTNNQQLTTEIFLEPVSEMLAINLADNKMEKKDENTTLPKRKKIFNYSLGIIANITGTSTSVKDPPLFYTQPSYAIGLTHEFMFWKRFAITNSIEFSQTAFKVSSPQTTDFYTAPLSYTSSISELDIPIGIKVYPVSKKKIRFSIGAGIINHFKLKETFAYQAPVYAAGSLNNISNYVAYPNHTVFGGGGQVSSFNSQGLSSPNSTYDFSINRSKRYYASFYASAGIDYVINKHFVFFAESLFYMSLEKIGVQNKNKYNLGLDGGFRYQF